MPSKKIKLPSLSTYKNLMGKFPICCVDVVFLNQAKDQTLLFKRDNEPVKNTFFTLGGALQKGEIFIQGAVRKIKEETSLTIPANRLTFAGVTNDLHNNSRFPKISYHAAVIFYYCTITPAEEKKIKLDEQHKEKKWFLTNDKKIHPLIKDRLKLIL